MIANWLTPTEQSKIMGEIPYDPTQLGAQVRFFNEDTPSLKGIKIAIIGIGDQADPVRSALYRMNTADINVEIADLGNLVNLKPSSTIPLFKELIEVGIHPVLIGFKSEDSSAIIEGISKVMKKRIRPLFVDDRIGLGKGFSRSYINPLFEKEVPLIDDLAVLAFQQQYSDIEHARKLFPFTHGLRLGSLRSAIQEAEPFIRDADVMMFMLSALKHAEAPAQLKSNPSGLFSEEACQLSKYAGLNENLRFFAVGNYDLQYDIHKQSAALIAQMIWYFMYGYQNRMYETNLAEKHFTKYMVQPDNMEEGFIFYKSEQTGRWWVKKQHENSIPEKGNPLRACSYEDYVGCTHNTISERLMELFQHAL